MRRFGDELGCLPNGLRSLGEGRWGNRRGSNGWLHAPLRRFRDSSNGCGFRRRYRCAGGTVQVVVGDRSHPGQQAKNTKPGIKRHATTDRASCLARLANSVLGLLRRFNRDRHKVFQIALFVAAENVRGGQPQRLLKFTRHRKIPAIALKIIYQRRMRAAQQRRILLGALQQEAGKLFGGRRREVTVRCVDHACVFQPSCRPGCRLMLRAGAVHPTAIRRHRVHRNVQSRLVASVPIYHAVPNRLLTTRYGAIRSMPSVEWRQGLPRGHTWYGEGGKNTVVSIDYGGNWRSGPESNRHTRICSPLHHHSATGP
jgi:hypothetical protein